MKKLIISLLSLFFSLFFMNSYAFAYGGGWTTGGGEIIEDSQNPWFIQNTKEIKYCVQIQRDKFFVPEQRIDELILASFEYWKKRVQRPGQNGDWRSEN